MVGIDIYHDTDLLGSYSKPTSAAASFGLCNAQLDPSQTVGDIDETPTPLEFASSLCHIVSTPSPILLLYKTQWILPLCSCDTGFISAVSAQRKDSAGTSYCCELEAKECEGLSHAAERTGRLYCVPRECELRVVHEWVTRQLVMKYSRTQSCSGARNGEDIILTHITNQVVMSRSTNITFAIGGSLLMAMAPEDMQDISEISSAFPVNFDTLGDT